jgi:hypothetical protein
MRSKIGKFRTTAAGVDAVREMLRMIVAHQQRRMPGCSKMLAYAAAGNAVGASPAWVRKFAGGAPDVRLGYGVGKMIEAAAARFEALAAAEAALAAKIQREIEGEMACDGFDAAVARDVDMVAGAGPAAGAGALAR